MKKIISFLTSITLMSTLIVGCSNKEENKQEEKKTEQKSEVKKENKLQHDFEIARNFVNDILSYEFNNKDINDKDLDYHLPGSFLTIQGFKNDIRKITLKNPYGEIQFIELKDIVDMYNAYNKKTYNEVEVLEDVKEELYDNKAIFFKEVDKSASNLSDEEVKSIFDTPQMVVYFRGDKTFAENIPKGIGGAGYPQAAPESEWKKTDDTLEIPLLNTVDPNKGKVARVVTIRLNDKKYDGGRKNSLYYYVDVK